MAFQLGLSFGNGPFIVHQFARVRQRALLPTQFLPRALCDLCAMIFPFREVLAIRGRTTKNCLRDIPPVA